MDSGLSNFIDNLHAQKEYYGLFKLHYRRNKDKKKSSLFTLCNCCREKAQKNGL